MAGNPESPETAGTDPSTAAETAVDAPGEAPEEVSLEIPRDAFDIDLPDHGVTLDDYIQTQGWTPAQIKESGAKNLATALVWIFGGTIFSVLVSAVVVTLVSSTVEEATEYTTTLISLLSALGDFSSAVFAPLLAFVLGYYFGEKQQGSGGG